MNINVDITFDDKDMIVSRLVLLNTLFLRFRKAYITDVYINNVITIKRNRLYLF